MKIFAFDKNLYSYMYIAWACFHNVDHILQTFFTFQALGMGNYMLISFVTLTTVIFLNYPPPEFSSRLKDWYKKGSFYKFGDYSIFYVGKVLILFHVRWITTMFFCLSLVA